MRVQGKSVVESLEHPRLVVAHNDNIVQVTPPALRFWNSMGASPLHGAKNVIAFTLYEPDDASPYTLVHSWVRRVGQAYQVCIPSALKIMTAWLSGDRCVDWVLMS